MKDRTDEIAAMALKGLCSNPNAVKAYMMESEASLKKWTTLVASFALMSASTLDEMLLESEKKEISDKINEKHAKLQELKSMRSNKSE